MSILGWIEVASAAGGAVTLIAVPIWAAWRTYRDWTPPGRPTALDDPDHVWFG